MSKEEQENKLFKDVHMKHGLILHQTRVLTNYMLLYDRKQGVSVIMGMLFYLYNKPFLKVQ